jgi:hypothetical protein
MTKEKHELDTVLEIKRRDLSEMLHNGVCEVTFTKVNGETRTMPCTLSEAIIPPAPVHVTNTDNPIDFPQVKKEKKVNPEVMSVWCLDKKEWRSFRVMNVTSITAV